MKLILATKQLIPTVGKVVVASNPDRQAQPVAAWQVANFRKGMSNLIDPPPVSVYGIAKLSEAEQAIRDREAVELMASKLGR